MSDSRRLWLVMVGVLCGCSYSLPLGGVDVGRGRPVPAGAVRWGASVGRSVELAGALPAVLDGSIVVNPVPSGDSLTTTAGGVDLLAFSVGITDAIDVGLSRSRGLNTMARVAGADTWALSLSPAIQRYSSRDPRELPGAASARVTNLNLTGLLSLDPWPEGPFAAEIYAGAGVTHFSGRIEGRQSEARGDGVVPTILGGAHLDGPRCLGRCRGEDSGFFTLGLETEGAWVTQRTGHTDFVPTLRLYFTLDVLTGLW